MSGSLLGKYSIQVDTSVLANGDSIAAYLVSASGALITSTTIGGKVYEDVKTPANHVDGSAYVATTDYLDSVGAVDSSGNWKPLSLNAAGELKVNANVTFTAEHNEDDPAISGDAGIFTLLVRQDTLASSTSADGDYGAFKSNALGELYVRDTSVLAQLVTANSTLTNIKSDTASIVTNTSNTASNTSTISSTLSALSKAEDAAHSSGDQGIQALAVRKDAQGSNVSADGDYASLIQWSEGSLKVVDIANGAILQQQLSAAVTATKLPTTPLANRKSLMIQNAGNASVYVGSATTTVSGATTGIIVPKGGFLELEVGPAVDIYGISVAGVPVNLLEMA